MKRLSVSIDNVHSTTVNHVSGVYVCVTTIIPLSYPLYNQLQDTNMYSIAGYFHKVLLCVYYILM